MDVNEIRKKIVEKSSRAARGSGNVNQGDIDRELARTGSQRSPADIPKQDTQDRQGNTVPGNVAGGFVSTTASTGGVYRMGPAVRPKIAHDAGFSAFPKRAPELADYWELLKWRIMLEGAEATRSDLSDATAAYRHYLEGDGKERSFDYERYVMNDASGQATLRNALLDAQDAALTLWQSGGKPRSFLFSGPVIPCGAPYTVFPRLSALFPYPATENWQKAIGAHSIWLSGAVSVQPDPARVRDPEFKLSLLVTAEDYYNFNPGQADIASGIPDSANGIFEVVGFAKGYPQSGVLRRAFSWRGFAPGVAAMGVGPVQRARQPDENRRARNRL